MNTLLHIPHASLDVPDEFFDGLMISKELFRRYNLEMSDIGIDELFRDMEAVRVQAPFSRLYCDVERFRDDEQEVMFQYGEGVIYTHTYDGIRFHEHDEGYRKRVLEYYDRYHKELDETAEKLLAKDEELLILDCHSFSDKMASHFFEPPFPDVCIGIEENYYDEKTIDRLLSEIDKKGYSYEVNYPYQGSLIPNTILSGKTKGKVVSIMLEINKRVYL